MAAVETDGGAGVASFLAIVPLPQVVGELVDLLGSVGVRLDVPPHVTVKAQANLDDPELWRPAVSAELAARQPVRLTLGGVDWFGDAIVYLSVGGDIDPLHRRVLDAVESVVDGGRFDYEGDHYVPHLTLAAEFLGHSTAQLQSVEALLHGWMPVDFIVDEIIEFRRSTHGGPCVPVGTFELGRPGPEDAN